MKLSDTSGALLRSGMEQALQMISPSCPPYLTTSAPSRTFSFLAVSEMSPSAPQDPAPGKPSTCETSLAFLFMSLMTLQGSSSRIPHGCHSRMCDHLCALANCSLSSLAVSRTFSGLRSAACCSLRFLCVDSQLPSQPKKSGE